VLGAGGRLGGFSAPGGVAAKLRLIAIEGERIARPLGLFDDLPLAARPSRRRPSSL
jgi:methylated-DNA-[protein]-cysteine S-methyltransferase